MIFELVVECLYDWLVLGFMVLNTTFNFSYIVAVNVLGGVNRRKPPTCRKSLANFIT